MSIRNGGRRHNSASRRRRWTPRLSLPSLCRCTTGPSTSREAIESVLAQTRTDWQLVVIDDGSTDDSRRVIEDLTRGDGRVVVVHHQVRRGPGAARNSGLRLARGRWIACLDSDDRWFPHTLQTYADYIAGHPDARFIYGYAHGLDEAGSVQERRPPPQNGPAGTRELFEHVFLLPSASCHRRDLLLESGPYDEGLPNAEDYDLFLADEPRLPLRAAGPGDRPAPPAPNQPLAADGPGADVRGGHPGTVPRASTAPASRWNRGACGAAWAASTMRPRGSSPAAATSGRPARPWPAHTDTAGPSRAPPWRRSPSASGPWPSGPAGPDAKRPDTARPPSIPSTLNPRVKPLEFDAGVGCGELPIDARLAFVAPSFPGTDLGNQGRPIADASA